MSSNSALSSSVLKVEDRCSLAPAVDILSYSKREWKGNTAKSALIRKVGACSSRGKKCFRLKPVVVVWFTLMAKRLPVVSLLQGYKEMSQRFGSLRRVRGDNYCALRATLFQVLSHSTELPTWLQEEDITTVNIHLTRWYQLAKPLSLLRLSSVPFSDST